MFVGTNGIVIDEQNRVVLILRDDTRTWALPGGALDAGELPTSGAAREVREETGLEVAVERLAGIYHWNQRSDGFLILAFRCYVQGGELRPSEESLRVIFRSLNDLPKSLLGLHRERIRHALVPVEERPYWGSQRPSTALRMWRRILSPLVYRAKDLRRLVNGQEPYKPPPSWILGAFVIIQNEAGEVLWIKRTDHDVWNLPGGGSEPREAPWVTAERETLEETGLKIELARLSGVYVKPESNTMLFTFVANAAGGELTTGAEAADFAYFASGQEPANALPKQIERVRDGVQQPETVHFRLQSGPPGLVTLGLVED